VSYLAGQPRLNPSGQTCIDVQNDSSFEIEHHHHQKSGASLAGQYEDGKWSGRTSRQVMYRWIYFVAFPLQAKTDPFPP